MNSLLTMICVAAGGYFLFRHGKHLGSRQAFNVGYRRARRRFGSQKRAAKR